jgi:precorrin-6Y C5,15-methyltransferase (decarboxylating)
MTAKRIDIIGIGPGGARSLDAGSARRIKKADIIFGGRRLLDMFPDSKAEKVPIHANLPEVLETIKPSLGVKKIVVLASGDPGFFGIAGYLAKALGKRAVNIIPDVSAMQLAFARIGESWEDAVFVSAHGRPIEDIIPRVRDNSKICIFTDKVHTPSAVAGALLENGVADYTAYVGENLGGKGERVTRTSLRGLRTKEFPPLNTLILLRNQGSESEPQTYLGIPDAEFHKRSSREGLITKQEVRAISLSKMRLKPGGTVWDIGSGSGAVAVEASFLASRGQVYAMEKNRADIAVIRRNIRKFKAGNIAVLQTLAPEGLEDIAAPDAVFIGGSSGRLADITGYAADRLLPGGAIVTNVVGLENLQTAVATLKKQRLAPEITMASISRSAATGDITRLAAMNPVFVVSAVKGEAKSGND